VVFSSITGEIESADYLWSNKKAKNAILVTGRWIETVVKDPGVGYSRRMMFLEASDIDSAYSAAPTGAARDSVIAQMQARGRAALAAQKELTLVKTDANKNASTYKYREHFEVGDIVTVEGSFSETRPMRVAEYVEIEDETGQSGYPTLTALSSEHNNRIVHLERYAVFYQLADRIVPNSIWPVMFPGENSFICSDLAEWVYITHYPTYWGV
jgi:hypothetical protein